MRVLLTGAGGFVGSRVARLLLRDGCEVHVGVRDDRIDRLGDVRDELRLRVLDLGRGDEVDAWVRQTQPELAIHCAWFAVPGRYLTAEENLTHVEIGLSLARSLAATGCRRLVGVGTCFEYAPSLEALSERSPTGPVTLYAESKLRLATALAALDDEGRLETAWARLFYLYGPYEDERRLVPSVARSLLAGRPAQTTSGEQRRDFLHVDDVASALWAIGKSGVTGAVNVGSGDATPVRSLVLDLADIVGRPDLVELGALRQPEGDPPALWADNRRLVEECGWAPRYTLAEGLRDTVEWWRERGPV